MQLIVLLLLLLSFILALTAFSLSISFFFGPPFVPTPKHIINEALDLVNQEKKEKLVDLGSGDGRVLIAAAKRNIYSIGYETNIFLVLWTIVFKKMNGLDKLVKVYPNNYKNADLKNITIVFCYNLPKYMPTIVKKLNSELPKNAKIISYKFQIQGLKQVKKTNSGIFLYKLNASTN